MRLFAYHGWIALLIFIYCKFCWCFVWKIITKDMAPQTKTIKNICNITKQHYGIVLRNTRTPPRAHIYKETHAPPVHTDIYVYVFIQLLTDSRGNINEKLLFEVEIRSEFHERKGRLVMNQPLEAVCSCQQKHVLFRNIGWKCAKRKFQYSAIALPGTSLLTWIDFNLSNSNSAAVGVREWMSAFIPHFNSLRPSDAYVHR